MTHLIRILRTALRGGGAVLVILGAAQGAALPTLVVRSQDGQTAWAVVREGGAAITEVWVAGSGESPRRLRTFPGRPDRIYWEGDRLRYSY